jgi:hypothetical protein
VMFQMKKVDFNSKKGSIQCQGVGIGLYKHDDMAFFKACLYRC